MYNTDDLAQIESAILKLQSGAGEIKFERKLLSCYM